jgi:hypothetical protein
VHHVIGQLATVVSVCVIQYPVKGIEVAGSSGIVVVLGAVDDFLNSWNTQVCVDRGIGDIPWDVNNRSQYI